MWYEIIPSFAVITLAMAFPHYSAYVFNWLLVDNFYKRRIADKTEALEYLRNKRLTGSPYILCGLECLPEEKKDANTVCVCLSDHLIDEKVVNPPKVDIPVRPKKKEEKTEGEGDEKKKKKEGGGQKGDNKGHKEEIKEHKDELKGHKDELKGHKDELKGQKVEHKEHKDEQKAEGNKTVEKKPDEKTESK